MQVVVSPYHLTTREPAAIAAFLLATRVVTMLPAPFNGTAREHVARLTARIPTYLDFMQSWRWTIPLWNEGVVCSHVGDSDAVEDVRAVCARIATEERYSSLRHLMKPELFDTEEGYLDAVARDVLKAGPDPAISVPLAAGIDRFAIRHGLIVARSEPSSVVQRAEERLGRRALAVAVPVLLQASGQRILDARRTLEPELAELRSALGTFAEEPLEGDDAADAQADLAVAARAYASAFTDAREELLAPDDDEDSRVIEGTVAVTGLRLPGDAALTSSTAAMRTLIPTRAQPEPDPRSLGHPLDPAENREFLTLLFRPLGRSTARGCR
jgi:hypothetical protein